MVGEEYIYIYTLPPPYISLHCHHQNDSCIRWAAMRAILMFHCEDKVTRQCPQTTAVFERKKKKKRNQAAALLLRLTARPNRLSLSLWFPLPETSKSRVTGLRPPLPVA